jgi:hypothetical protein
MLKQKFVQYIPGQKQCFLKEITNPDLSLLKSEVIRSHSFKPGGMPVFQDERQVEKQA